MAKERMVNTRFWIDDYISNLDPIEKLLFLYFLTNPSTDISGVYEVPLKTVAVDTGIDKEMVIKIIKRFEKDKKIKYQDGWVAIKNFIKHQRENPKVARGIEISMTKCPKWCIDYVYSIDILSHSNSNLKSNTNTKEDTFGIPVVNPTDTKNKFTEQGAEVLKAFEVVDPKNKTYYGNKTQRGACDFLISEYGLDKVVAVIKILPKTNQQPYFPSITTPFELKEKWVKLESSFPRKGKEITSKGRGIA